MIPIIEILSDFFSLVLMLAAIAVILYLSYAVSRKLGGGMMRTGAGGNIKVVEKAYLDRDKSIVIVRIGGKNYLLGVSAGNISLLQELEEGQVQPSEREDGSFVPAPPFASVIKKKLGKEK